jgi:hypothetical protein
MSIFIFNWSIEYASFATRGTSDCFKALVVSRLTYASASFAGFLRLEILHVEMRYIEKLFVGVLLITCVTLRKLH